jgi:hypothetical protein
LVQIKHVITMNTTRKRPGFNKEDSCLSFLGGAILFLTGLGSILGFIFADKKTFIDLIYQLMICLFSLGLVSCGVLIFLFGFSAYKDKKNWFSNATKAQTTIVNRTEASQEDQDGRSEKYWSLVL